MSESHLRIVGAPFTEAQIAAVARLHATEVSTGFLASLGEPVLRLLYGHLADSPRCALFVAEPPAGGEPLGYICGTGDTGALYREFLRRRWWVALRVLAPRLLSPTRIRRALETLRYPGAADVTLPKAEIVNFVVVPACRGQGVAAALFDELMTWFRAHGETAVKVVTGEGQERAHGFYEKSGALLRGRTSIHRGDRSRVYIYPNRDPIVHPPG
ncbi:GNAT family N-acetyltransferase [Micromonosporaceae bacterium Da 78-11]